MVIPGCQVNGAGKQRLHLRGIPGITVPVIHAWERIKIRLPVIDIISNPEHEIGFFVVDGL